MRSLVVVGRHCGRFIHKLVIPSNRPALLAEFLQAWEPVKDWDGTIIAFGGPPVPKIEGTEGCLVSDWDCC